MMDENTALYTDDASMDIPESFRLATYSYELPPDLIAQKPSPERDRSRLLHLNRRTGAVAHHLFAELPGLLRPSDVLVLNETKVIPAFLQGKKTTGGRVELLVTDPGEMFGPGEFHAVRTCITKSSKPIKPGSRILVGNGVELECIHAVGPGRIQVRFPVTESMLLNFLEEHGKPPLPPYIHTAKRDEALDRCRYQTIYGRVAGSVAAPTAGLHFSEKLLKELEGMGILVARIILHVGPGTFLPVRTQDVRLHTMESEYFEISDETARNITRAAREGRRVIAVGSTSTRALETAVSEDCHICPGKGKTSLFILPGYRFKIVKGIITNFHLPESTLLMLVCALGGTDRVLSAYRQAVHQKYRFYSYGDASLIAE
ncbi:tRNA preQ1(34) S-adenosylmethionine ribosyltransferase-isomerase QueA [Desulfomonile tiedjei]|uniref:S-adenosylmethionine:tRNA ribosyltransferase-isomerase n=1 Tax=Desulfomonile tiedjei (strain ATCC 49306 / DSM 6799 / DCB-1) TaxID=706587 RepID=I4C9T4_DESTA|nr:tRNA preQ1(34) S-adenosylmethionine ribosyltransferase-isomerase QueA [Desulfomonile tiedjei]AFM26325.1 S-adenosylmethionine:tRNA ribosyltransferase-isomerase [Desulfomonile tiedjei DSM 6799]